MEIEIDNFLGRDKAKEVLNKLEELQDLLISFGICNTSGVTIDKLEEVLFNGVIKFEKSKL